MEKYKNEQSDIRQSLIACADELRTLQSSDAMGFTEVEQRHGRADNALVELHDRNGAPVSHEWEKSPGDVRQSFVGRLGGVCLNCPVLQAGDGCALRESFHEITTVKRAKNAEIACLEPTTVKTARTPRKINSGRKNVPQEVKKSFLPENQLIHDEDAAAKEQRIREIAEKAKARDEAVAGIFKARRAGYAYPGSATRLKQTRNELNEDHTDHVSADN